MNSCILVISDTHCPFHHKDAWKFLAAVKKRYKPTRIIHIGDEEDKHNLSFHDHDPDLPGPGHELKLAHSALHELHSIFPKMELLHSNHGSLAYRKAKNIGMPAAYLRPYGEILGVGPGWTWHDEILIKVHNFTILFRHQFQANILKAAEQMGCCVVQGHHHSHFEIGYTSSPTNLNWGMTVGCLVDTKSLAMAYNKLQVKRPILGVGIIFEGQPALIPMVLKKNGRWDGNV